MSKDCVVSLNMMRTGMCLQKYLQDIGHTKGQQKTASITVWSDGEISNQCSAIEF